MKTNIQHDKFDTRLEASDWRSSAAIVGLLEYFRYHDIPCESEDDYILYNSKDITEEKYLMFVEYKYGNEFHHKKVESILEKDEISEGDIKLVNEKLGKNEIMKKIFKGIKFDNTNQFEILDVINKNRLDIIRETFRNKKNMYANYLNIKQFFEDNKNYCRLPGYYVDAGRKSKSMGYNFTNKSFVGNNILEYDFIPFAFEGNNESFFINDNYSIKRLLQTKNMFKFKTTQFANGNKLNARKALFKGMIETSYFIDRDVEIIFKDKDKEYYETFYLRKDCIDIFKSFLTQKINYESFCFSYEVNKNYKRNIEKEVTECIINKKFLDNLIELFLKSNNEYLVKQLIKINILIRGGKEMNDKLKGAFACGKIVAKKLEKNKLESYRQKLISSMVFRDYDKVCQILLQLSNYSNIEFGFAYSLYENFEDNKDLAYTFINALTNSLDNKSENKSEENNEEN